VIANTPETSFTQSGLLFCIFDDEKNKAGLQVFDISIAVFNNIFFIQVCCSVVY